MHSRFQNGQMQVDRFITGLWTQRNPLRDAAVPLNYQRGGYGRYDSIIDGLNAEISAKLTLKRRAGTSVYNSQTFDPINRFFEFRTFSGASETIRVMVDTATQVIDGTGPNRKTPIYNKAAGAGSSYFQSIGNEMFWGDGLNQKKWVQSERVWQAAHTFTSNDFIVDSNLNLQVAMGARSANITNVSLTSNVCTLTFDSRVSLMFFIGMKLDISSLVTATFLNGSNITIVSVSYNQITFAFVHANYPSAADTGTASCAGGNTGGSEPVWGTVKGNITADGNEQWFCKGSSVQNMGIATPTLAPTPVLAPRQGPYPDWAANTVYSPSLTIFDGAHLQRLTTGGTTGGGAPVWNAVLGGTTADGSCVWTNVGTGAWAAATHFSVGDVIYVTWTYWVTVPPTPPRPACFSGNTKVMTQYGARKLEEMTPVVAVITECGPRLADLIVHDDFDGEMIDMGDGELVTLDHPMKQGEYYVDAEIAFPDAPRVHFTGKVYNLSVRTEHEKEKNYILENGNVAHNKDAGDDGDPGYSYEVTASAAFECVTAGTTGGSQPEWIDGVGSFVSDNTVVWENIGSQSTWPGATTNLSLAQSVMDSNGSLQNIVTPGKSGAVHPTWATTVGASTVDNTAVWSCAGPFSAAGTAPWGYAFCGKNSITNSISNRSPISDTILLTASNLVNLQGRGFDDEQVDIIQIFRTLQGGSSLFLLDEIPAPAGGSSGIWSYSDSSFDDRLNLEIQPEDIDIVPPTGLINLAYHFERIWGSVGHTLYFAVGPSTSNGYGNEQFRASNSFVCPSSIRRLWPTAIGLLVFTVTEVYIVKGKGTATEPFYMLPFLKGLGLLSYDAFSVNGTIAHLMNNARKQMSLDPGAGLVETGYPIGDKFKSSYDPAHTYCTWHEESSEDTGLFVADGSTGWYRFAPVTPPETGALWNPKAVIAAGCKAVQSVETSPGTRNLLIGPADGTTGHILKRDSSVNKDDATTFAGYGTIGSLVMAKPGEMAQIDFLTLDSIKVGTQWTVGLLLDEISGGFESLAPSRQDPPLLPKSTTLYGDRYYCQQNQSPTYCRHMQVKFSFPAEDAANELLSFTIFGEVLQEKR